jgi:hypothetical protein
MRPFAVRAWPVKAMSLHIVEPGHSFVDRRTLMPHQPGTSAQRIRVGLTSLAVVFLIVLVASAITRASRTGAGNAVTQATANEPSEPLAELGVAPGASDSTNASNSVANKK